MSAFSRPTPNVNLRSQSIALWAALPLVAVWYDFDAWALGASGLIEVASGAGAGFIAAASDGSGAYMLQASGVLAYLSASGTVSAYPTPSGSVFTGMAYNG